LRTNDVDLLDRLIGSYSEQELSESGFVTRLVSAVLSGTPSGLPHFTEDQAKVLVILNNLLSHLNRDRLHRLVAERRKLHTLRLEAEQTLRLKESALERRRLEAELERERLALLDGLIRSYSEQELSDDNYATRLVSAVMSGISSAMPDPTESRTALLGQVTGLLSNLDENQIDTLIAERRTLWLKEFALERRRLEAEQQREREARERRRREEDVRSRKQAFVAKANSQFESAFLDADEILTSDPDYTLLSDAEHLTLKSQFVQAWASRELKTVLDLQQAAAVSAVSGDILVVARAGAGKTQTLVTRALFLQKHCGVRPSELLLLAFNKAAAREIRNRLETALGDRLPHVMTFHALAHALVHPEEDLLYDEPSAGNLGLSRQIQRVIDEHLLSETYRPLVRDLMLMHFRDDWERIVDGGFHLPIDELIKHRNALPRETLKGEYVKSFGEKLIANTLFQNDIDYKYERNFRWDGVNYRPDFTILLPDRRGVVIEYFGLEGDPDYDQKSQEKRTFWANRKGWTLLELTPGDITSRGAAGAAELLLKRLEESGVAGQCLSDEELWQRIRRRAVDKFSVAMKSFVGRCRKGNLSIDQLRHDVQQHTPIVPAERLFLDLGVSVYSSYLDRLASSRKDDFDGLLWRAVEIIEGGKSRFVRDRGRERGDLRSTRFVLVDEFQDFTAPFYALSQGIRLLNPAAEFFSVGDDWQAINGFAGSDLRYLDDFASFFRATRTLNVTTNHRSPVQVVEVCNALMYGRGAPAIPSRSDAGWVRTARLNEFTPSAAEQERYSGDEATPALLRLVRHILDSGRREVVMLSRRNDVPWYVDYAPSLRSALDGLELFAEHVRTCLPEEDRHRVTASTAHAYKGREKDAVIVLDADEGRYPLIHPNWVFLRMFGDTIERLEAAERRLFYVALTRSQHSLVILSNDSNRESRYLADIRAKMPVETVEWDVLPPVGSLDGARLEVRVLNAYDGRDSLKESGYQWNAPGKYWRRPTLAQGFDFEALCDQPWARRPGVRIEVWSETGELIKRR